MFTVLSGTPQSANLRSLRPKRFWILMIFWNEKKLAVRLRDDMVSAKEQLFYFLAAQLIICTYATATVSNLFYSSINTYDRVSDVLMLTTVVGLIFYTYSLNNKGDGKDFIVRSTCVSLPLSIKTFILSQILGTAAFFMDNINFEKLMKNINEKVTEPDPGILSEHMGRGPSSLALTAIVYLYLLWRYHVYFKIASGQTARETVNV